MLDNVQQVGYYCKHQSDGDRPMPSNESKTAVFYLRVEPSLKRRFEKEAARYPGEPTDVLRWLILGFVEGRVTVKPAPPVKE